MQYFCGVDTGGTFTDCVLMDEQGQIVIAKSPSTPKDFAEGFFNALEVAAEKLSLTLDEAQTALRSLLDQHVKAIAISFLWGFVNPTHELAVKRLVQDTAPDIFVTCAHELIAKPGEYERTAATAREAAQKPLFTIGSRPVGGVIGSKFLADTLGHQNVITSDVGGTSFDVGIISNSGPLTSSETIIHQYTFFMPQLDMQSIGSGGGSIIWMDR